MYYVYCLRRSHTYVDLCTVPTHVTCGKKNPHIFCKQPPSHQISNLTPLLSSPFPLLLFLLLTCDLLLISFHLLTLTRYVTGSFSSYSPFLHRTSSGALCCTHGFVLFRVFHTSRDYSHSRRLHHTIPDHIALSSGRYERSSSCCLRFFLVSSTERFSVSKAEYHAFSFCVIFTEVATIHTHGDYTTPLLSILLSALVGTNGRRLVVCVISLCHT